MLKAFTERVAVANTCREQFRWCWPSEVEEWFSGSGLILSGLVFYVYEAEVCPEIVDRENPRSSFLDAAQSWGCSWLCLAGSQCGSKPARPRCWLPWRSAAQELLSQRKAVLLTVGKGFKITLRQNMMKKSFLPSASNVTWSPAGGVSGLLRGYHEAAVDPLGG